MKKGFVVSAILYPLLVIALTLILGVIAMSDNRRKILDNMKLEVSEESETDPEMSNSALYYKMKALEEAYAEMASRLSEERFEELQDTIKKDYENKINAAKNSVISTAKTQTKLEAFPIGSIFISTNITNPSSYIGGSWEAYGQGRTLIGAGTGTDSNSKSQTFSSGSVGGEYTHTLTTNEMPSHSHNNTAVSNTITGQFATIVPLSYEKFSTGAFSGGIALSTSSRDAGSIDYATGAIWGHRFSATPTIVVNNATTGGNNPHNNIQPYITVYFWKRIS